MSMPSSKKEQPLNDKKKQDLLQKARKIAASIDDLFFNPNPSPIAVQKGEKDFATEADIQAHIRLSVELAKLIPGVRVLSEEAPLAEQEDIMQDALYWVIDPIDGTLNFASGNPLCGSTIALIENGKPILGVLRFPRLKEEYWSIKGMGSFSNDKKLDLTSDPAQPKDHLVCHGILPSQEGSISQRELASSFLSTQSIGSAALALAWSAKGTYGACLFRSNRPWDMQAGVLIVQEAGGTVSDWRSEPYHIQSKTIVAGSSACVNGVLEIFKKNNAILAAEQVLSNRAPSI